MNIQAYLDSYPVFNRWNRERHADWEDKLEILNETVELAERLQAPDQERRQLEEYRSVLGDGLSKSRSNDRRLSVTKAITHATGWGFVVGFGLMFQDGMAGFPLRFGLTLASGLTMVAGELLFRSFLAKGEACGDF